MQPLAPSLFSPVSSAGISEAIVRRIGELVGSGELEPGSRLPPESELAQSFGVAAMTVRAALVVLKDNGLIETRRGRGGGSFVRTDAMHAPFFEDVNLPTAEDFEDFTVWRAAVSGQACARVASKAQSGTLTDGQRSRLTELADASHASGMLAQEFRIADAQFHRYIAELSDSSRLVEAERNIQADMTRVLRHMVRPPDVSCLNAQSHMSLLDAMLNSSPEQARAALEVHVFSTVDLIVGVRYLRSNESDRP